MSYYEIHELEALGDRSLDRIIPKTSNEILDEEFEKPTVEKQPGELKCK